MLGTEWLKSLRNRQRGLSKAARMARRRTARYRTGRLGLVETLESRTMLTPAIASFDLYSDTGTPGDYITSDPRVTGTVTSSYPGSATLEFDYDGNGTADSTATPDANGVFVHNPGVSVNPGDITIRVRARELNWQTYQTEYSAWASLTYTWQNLPPQVNSFEILNPPPGYSGATLDGMVTGTVSNPDGHVSGVSIQVDYNGDDAVDDNVVVNSDGTFTFNMGTAGYGMHTIRVRGAESMPSYVTGEWVSLDVTYIAPPEITSFSADEVGWHDFSLDGHVNYYDPTLLTIQISGVVEGTMIAPDASGWFWEQRTIHEEGYVYVVAIDQFGRESNVWQQWILVS